MPDDLDPATTVASAVNLWLALAVACWAASGAYRLRGTTLAAPVWWAVAAALSLALVELACAWSGAWDRSLAASLARHASGVGTLCPIVAVLGAKRPQDRGWQWVVASLWIVLLVPAGQAWAAHASQLSLAPLWRFLLGGLIGLGLLNYLPTRFTIAAALAACGQWRLLAGGVVEPGVALSSPRTQGLIALLLAALAIEALGALRPRGEATTRLAKASQRWLAFRDGWGAFWGLRVRNRINEAAELADWPVRLEWNGFVAVAPSRDDSFTFELDDSIAAHVEQTMDSVLRRFERGGASSPSEPRG